MTKPSFHPTSDLPLLATWGLTDEEAVRGLVEEYSLGTVIGALHRLEGRGERITPGAVGKECERLAKAREKIRSSAA